MSHQPTKRSDSPGLHEHNQDQDPLSRLEKATQLFRQAAEDGLHTDLIDLIKSRASPDKIQVYYTPIFKDLTQLIVGRTDIPVPPRRYVTDFLHSSDPNLEVGTKRIYIENLIEYIEAEDKANSQDSQSEFRLAEALRLLSQAIEHGLSTQLDDLVESHASDEQIQASYTPIFKDLAQLFAGRTDIPVLPRHTTFFMLSDPNVAERVKRYLIRDLIRYIKEEDEANPPYQPSDYNPEPFIAEAIKTAWETKYIGESHILLKVAVERMWDRSRRPYTNFCSIIQGSGTGKSRTVDKFAELVFTIPMVLRPEEDKFGYPLGDRANEQPLLDFFCQNPLGTAFDFQRRYLLFLLKTITYVDHWLDLRSKSGHVTENIAADWKEYIGCPLSPRRVEMYTEAIDPSPLRGFERMMSERTDFDELRFLVTKYIGSILKKIGSNRGPVLVFSFDEAHNLTKKRVTKGGEPIRTAYQCLCKALTYMAGVPVFALFLSTYSRLSEYTPSPPQFWSSRPMSSDGEGNDDDINAPFVELPYDIWKKSSFVVEGTHTAQEICSLEFMVRFGRPLFWALLENTPSAGHRDAMKYAISKLQLRPNDTVQDKSRDYPSKELIPLLAVRVDLTFESNRDEAVFLEGHLVASSMRTVYSVPWHRQYLCGGYSSEPFIAEAAARAILNHCRIEGLGTEHVDGSMDNVEKIITKYKASIPSAVVAWLERGLIDKKSTGELVAKMLCTLAHDISILKNPDLVDDVCKHGDVSFSQMIPVVDFLRSLIAEEHINMVLNAKPSNVNGMTLREAFKDAFVHFTQFVKAGDKSTITDEGVYLLFLRGAAIQGYGNMDPSDLVIPVWIRTNESDYPDRWSMSAIFIRVKDRANEGFIPVDAQETFQFFTKPQNETQGRRILPYITIAMELAILAPEQKKASKPVPTVGGTQQQGKRSQGKKNQAQLSMSPTSAVKEQIRGTTKQPPMPVPTTTQKVPPTSAGVSIVSFTQDTAITRNQVHIKSVHPRYEILIKGCSHRVYNVIGDGDQSYSSILADKDVLAEHPRKDPRFLAAVRQMKPYWVGHSSYEWAKMNEESCLGTNVGGNNNTDDDDDDDDEEEFDAEDRVVVDEYRSIEEDSGEPMNIEY